jgi:hypothetical protein
MDNIEFSEKISVIKELMDFSVPEQYLADAAGVLEIYSDDRIVLDMLHEFYSFLPEAKDDWVREVRIISRHKGIFLLLAVTEISGYMYLVSSEGVEFHGPVGEGIWDKELLDFFDIENPRDLLGENSIQDIFPLYEPLGNDTEVCPACHAAAGELHVLGCPVEVCPWCGGQFIHCNCRFEKLGVEFINSEEELAAIEKLLEEQGRISYSPDQRPFFPTME